MSRDDEIDLDTALVKVASHYVQGNLDAAAIAFSRLRPRIDSYTPPTSFARKRLEVLCELDQTQVHLAKNQPLARALARACLVDDQDGLDALVEREWGPGRYFDTWAVRETTHLARALEHATELVLGKKRIVAAARAGLFTLAVIVVDTIYSIVAGVTPIAHWLPWLP